MQAVKLARFWCFCDSELGHVSEVQSCELGCAVP